MASSTSAMMRGVASTGTSPEPYDDGGVVVGHREIHERSRQSGAYSHSQYDKHSGPAGSTTGTAAIGHDSGP